MLALRKMIMPPTTMYENLKILRSVYNPRSEIERNRDTTSRLEMERLKIALDLYPEDPDASNRVESASR